MDYTISYFTWSFWDTSRIPHDQASPSQSLRLSRCLWFPPKWSRDHFWPITGPVILVFFPFKPMPINTGTYHIQPLRCTWVVLWLFCFRSTPQRSLISRVHFGESLVNRLYSEIDHTYLSIEAQCVSRHYPRWTATPSLLLSPPVSMHDGSYVSLSACLSVTRPKVLEKTHKKNHIFCFDLQSPNFVRW